MVKLSKAEGYKGFGLELNDGMRVVSIDAGSPASASNLQLLDLVIACDGKRVSSNSIGSAIGSKSAIALTIERPEDSEACSVARAEGVTEWTEWKRGVVACAAGDLEDILAVICDLDDAVSRSLTMSEARIFGMQHSIRGLAAGQCLADIATVHGHGPMLQKRLATAASRCGEDDLIYLQRIAQFAKLVRIRSRQRVSTGGEPAEIPAVGAEPEDRVGC